MSEQTAKTNALLRKKKVLPAEPVPGSAAALPSFDPLPIIEKLDLWCDGSKYYLLGEDGLGYSAFAVEDVKRLLRVDFGLSQSPMALPDDPSAGKIPGQIDRLLNYVMKYRRVDEVATVAGMKVGVAEVNGLRLLCKSSYRLIEPVAGDCNTMLEFLDTLLGSEGSLRFRLWLKHGYESLREGRRSVGCVLFLIGVSGTGKSVTQKNIITEVLGGRAASPKDYFLGDKFNADLIRCEHLSLGDAPLGVSFKERQIYGERIKEMLVNPSQRLRAMHSEGMFVSPQWRLSISMNDDPECYRTIPPLHDGLKEKFLMLKVQEENFFARYDGKGGTGVFIQIIGKELPSFCAHLLSLEVPESLSDRRYGVRSFIDPEIGEMLFDQEGESILLALIDDIVFGSSSNLCFNDETGSFSPWEASSTEVVDKLTEQGVKGYSTARKLLDGSADKCGQLLGKLSKKFPERFEKGRSGSRRYWIIKPSAEGVS